MGNERRRPYACPLPFRPRRCPARNFSLYEQRVLISMLLREYRWTLPKDSVHNDGLKNGFSAFALNLPENLDIDFVRIAPGLPDALEEKKMPFCSNV